MNRRCFGRYTPIRQEAWNRRRPILKNSRIVATLISSNINMGQKSSYFTDGQTYKTIHQIFLRNTQHSQKIESFNLKKILTRRIFIFPGYAFIHKAYFFQYTYEMPEKIRKEVDLKMNCEDIAMNFLVSHSSKKSPIKVS